ncbi:MAG: SAM-dependent methyltransferase [Acidobacteria bacterium]|nr:SAM-dependent methyltransferase [Acidobacteriota bacterium]
MTELDVLVGERLAQGPLPAGEFMALALYHPRHGYYRRAEGPWGFEGKDYYTALDAGPLLGKALALRLESAWDRLGRPESFTVLEPGAGRGWLGRDILAAAEGAFSSALRYLHQDDNPAGRQEAREALGPWLKNGRACLLGEDEDPPPLLGAVISNELFDALPAQPWRWDGTRWVREVLTLEGPAWEASEPGSAGDWFSKHLPAPEPGDGSVWCEAMPALVTRLAGCLRRGLFLAVDYGDSADRLLTKGADLRRFSAHVVDGRWWEDPGGADLTADVDFTRLQELLEGEGFGEFRVTTLSRWIRDHAPLGRWERDWQELESRERVRRMENLLQLTMPGMLGERFRVLEAWNP